MRAVLIVWFALSALLGVFAVVIAICEGETKEAVTGTANVLLNTALLVGTCLWIHS